MIIALFTFILSCVQAADAELTQYEDDLLHFGHEIHSVKQDVEKLRQKKADDEWLKEIDEMQVHDAEVAINNEQRPENQGIKYSGLNSSLIQWEKLNPIQWNDLSEWKRERALKDKYAKWYIALKHRRLEEMMGRVIDCVGQCWNYRGVGKAQVQFKSSVKEGDEVVTGKDSYVWIFLMDGTLVRISPQSSVSFKEINVANEQFFFHSRVNYGNVLWLSRLPEEIEELEGRETDALFLPLSFFEANMLPVNYQPRDDQLYEFMLGENLSIKQYHRLNEMIGENNKIVANRQSNHFVVMPNGTIYGKNLQLEMVALDRGKSYFKNRGLGFYLAKDKAEQSEIKQEAIFYQRGYINREETTVQNDQWYEVDEEGKNVGAYDKEDPNFSFGEYLTKRIPSIMVAREMMLKQYSQNLFLKTIKEGDLAQDNYRLWNGFNKVVKDEMSARLYFLKEYTRREETTNLRTSQLFQERLKERGEVVGSTPYSDDFYSRAVNYFIYRGNRREEMNSDQEILNSTKKKFWTLINSKRAY